MGEKDTKYGTKNLRVESALYRAAVGYKVKLKKPVKVKEEYNRPGEGKQVVERMVTVEEEKYVEPKITAQVFWLKSRRPEEWGAGGGEAEEMEPVLETYAAMLDTPVAERDIGEMNAED